MSRLAFFSPWPPQPSGVAACSADVVLALAAAGHAIDVFVDEALVSVTRQAAGPPQAGQIRVLGAHDFVWRQARGQYDLPIYQLGNSWAHGYVWPYLFRWPGLVVLHDARLHHARADVLLRRKRVDDYRAEFRYNHPGVAPGAAELGVSGFDGTYYYHWPMRKTVLDSARMVATHSMGVVKILRRQHPKRAIEHIPLGHGIAVMDLAAARREFRAQHGIPEDALVFGILGTAASEKRVGPVIRAFAAARQWAPDARLLFAGHVDPLLDLEALLSSFGVRDMALMAGRVDDQDFDRAVAACDIGLNLRWPTALEISGPWLRMLSAGLPTVIVDTVHHLDIVTLDPRTWRCHEPAPDLSPHPETRAVAIGIDILDEDHSLRLAMRRLGADAAFRRQLGTTARAYWESNHSIGAMVAGYEQAIGHALLLSPPAVELPGHLRPDVTLHARKLVHGIVDELPFLGG